MHASNPALPSTAQAEFKTTHKRVDQVRGNELRPGELRTEIGQLEDEKKQLAEKIEKLKANVTDEPGARASPGRRCTRASTTFR